MDTNQHHLLMSADSTAIKGTKPDWTLFTLASHSPLQPHIVAYNPTCHCRLLPHTRTFLTTLVDTYNLLMGQQTKLASLETTYLSLVCNLFKNTFKCSLKLQSDMSCHQLECEKCWNDRENKRIRNQLVQQPMLTTCSLSTCTSPLCA